MSRDGICVIGAGGHAKVVVATVRAAGGRVRAILDDDVSLHGGQVLGVPVAGPVSVEAIGGAAAVVAVGDNRTRRDLVRRLRAEWVTVVHPQAAVDPSVTLGPGTVVFAGAVIQPDARVGRHVILNTGARVDHDCVLGDFVHLGPGATLCGRVRVDEGALLGVGCCARPSVRVGAWSIVGAGAACVRDVEQRSTVIGVPARPNG